MKVYFVSLDILFILYVIIRMSEKILHRVAVLLSMISILTVIIWVKVIAGKMDAIAALQFWWESNYAIAKQLFTSDKFVKQQEQTLKSALDQSNWTTPDTTTVQPSKQPDTANNQNQDEQFPSGKLTPDQLSAIKKDAVIEGDKNAKVTIVEYSDPECPFCIRHFNDKTIANAVAAFPGNANHIFKVVQGVNHPGTEYKSLAILCAKKLWWDDAYIGMYTKILWSSTTSAPVAKEKVDEFAKDLKLNTSDLADCIQKWDTKSTYAANWAEFQTFTDRPGTPGNIVINNETGEWKLIAGAYPVDTFKQIIGAWVK